MVAREADSPEETHGDTPEAVAQAFLSALDAGRWREAASYVHPETAERFRVQLLVLLKLTEHDPQLSAAADVGDTRFVNPATLVGVRTPAEAEVLSAVELLARFAAALDPAATHHRLAGIFRDATDRLPRLIRTVVGATPETAETARAEYRTDWFFGNIREPGRSGIHRMRLRRTLEGWRVQDADLSGTGEGRLTIPDEVFSKLQEGFGGSSGSSRSNS